MSQLSSHTGDDAGTRPVPAPMPALDVAAGIERVMGDTGMYLRVLTRFRSDYAGNAARLRTAIAAGDITVAHRIAHTVKGAAAMIEARELRALAADVEQLLRAGTVADSQLQPLIDQLEAELARVMAQVDGLIAAPAAYSAGSGEATLLEGDMAQLCELLDLGDSGAQDFVAEKRAGLRTRLGALRMTQLESALAAFDYEQALRVLGPSQGRQSSG